VTLEIGLLLALLAAALVLFSRERVPPDVVALGVLLALVLTRLVPPDEAFAGFGSDTVIMILGLLILTAALMKTGVVDIAGRWILRRTGRNPDRLLLVVMVAAAGLGALMSNTASTAFFIPVVIGLARRSNLSPSRLLLPLAFASILTSSVTLVSTSTNIVVSGLMTQHGLEPMGMFEMAPVGIPIAIVGILYMMFIGRRLLPQRDRVEDKTLGLRPYLTEVVIPEDSSLVGKTLAESGLGRDLDLTVLRLVRGGRPRLAPRPEERLQAGDVLLVEGERDEVLKVKDHAGIEIKADVELSLPSLESDEVRLVEAVLLPHSPLIGSTLRATRFRQHFGLQVLAINRRERQVVRNISRERLQLGDVLLVQGPNPAIALAEQEGVFSVLAAVERARPDYRRAPVAVLIFVLVLALATAKLVGLAVAVMLGVLLVFITRCISPEEAYREVEWKALILIGCMLALGRAMETTGTAAYLSGLIVEAIGGAGTLWILSGFFALTVFLTQPMSNQAAAVVVLPIALQTAVQLGSNPRTFAMMVAVAASCSYLTPLEPSCLMVYGPGHYRFSDFLKVGALLTVLIWALAVLLVPRVWPL
jgi:di/tricarboxylate transporter